mmetsp:Transcript_10895/g.46461  ORF Transcript_10895/g.46461 Transcript_10895/m.46461 type:complete len:315 (-) Transcript_10895:920-1864(-)
MSRWRTIASTMVCVFCFLLSRSSSASRASRLILSTSAWYCSLSRAPCSSWSSESARITESWRLFCSCSSSTLLKSTSSAVTTEAASTAARATRAGTPGPDPGCFSSATSCSRSFTCRDRSADCASSARASRSLCRDSATWLLVSASMRRSSTVVFSRRARISACAEIARSYSALCSANIGARCSSSAIMPSTVLCRRLRSKHSARHASAASAYFVYSSVMLRFSRRSAAADASGSCIASEAPPVRPAAAAGPDAASALSVAEGSAFSFPPPPAAAAATRPSKLSFASTSAFSASALPFFSAASSRACSSLSSRR